MKKNFAYVTETDFALCRLDSGVVVRLPVVPGILKHPSVDLLRHLLQNPSVARKYTKEALRVAPWQVLREFPYDWLKLQIEAANIRPLRKKAILFMISGDEENGGIGYS